MRGDTDIVTPYLDGDVVLFGGAGEAFEAIRFVRGNCDCQKICGGTENKALVWRNIAISKQVTVALI